MYLHMRGGEREKQGDNVALRLRGIFLLSSATLMIGIEKMELDSPLKLTVIT